MNNNLPEGYIACLDQGYVGLTNHMGTDADIVSAARISFDKKSKLVDGKLEDRDKKLMNYLVRNKEMSVFRHATVAFEMYMPLFVCRQYWRYVIAASHIDDGTCINETSRRYITEVPTFYIPEATEWRSVPENKKQGSGTPIDTRLGALATEQLMKHVDEGVRLYEYWNQIGIAPEQSRLFLTSYGMYVRVRTTMSLAALLHLLEERLDGHAQYEFQVYAQAMRDLVKPLFPTTFESVGM